jgi:multiple sugar transport system substrate-binding protein
MVAGVMHGGVYYNKKMWEAAGLTEKDFPKTWDELIEVAKKLTKRDASGRISVAGFAFNGGIGHTFPYLRYQLGEFFYTKDGKRVKYDTPGMRKCLQWFLDAYDKHQVNSRDFPEARQAFATEKAAMTFQWSWVTGWLEANYKNLEWGIFACPTWTGKYEPAVGPNNYDPLSFVVPKTTPPEKKEAAWDFIYWMFGDPERVIRHALIAPSVPAMLGLQDHPKVKENPTLRALSPQTEYTIFAFGAPPKLGEVWTKYFEEGIFKAGMSIEEAIRRAEEEGNQYMAEGEWPAPFRERAYRYAHLMKQDY